MQSKKPNDVLSEIFQWGDNFLLGYGPIDNVHQEFVNQVSQLLSAPNEDLLELMSALEMHTKSHFDLEKKWMVDTQFPPMDCHVEEHDAVIQSISEVRDLVAAGDYDVCRRLATSLADWFPKHADHLDSALAHWMCKIQFGGKPVVIRRNMEKC